jgi:uroporphyrin-III C-methyltransferase/precorrin-2 dehydrogenase/sirohydrochlorin ferrochelatase
MDHLPIFINVRQNPCLVIGGGDIALRKINLLIKAQAKVDCLSPLFCEGITNLSQNGDVNLIQKRFESDDIKDYAIIIASTDDSSVNALISKSAKKARIPVNVVDSPELSSFIMPSIVDRSPVIIAVSSAGKGACSSKNHQGKIRDRHS